MSWAEIKKAVNSDLSKPLNELISELSVIKSIQRGVVKSTSILEGNQLTITIPISTVNPNKSFVLLSNDLLHKISGTVVTSVEGARLVSLLPTQIIISPNSWNRLYNVESIVSWQIIEFR